MAREEGGSLHRGVVPAMKPVAEGSDGAAWIVDHVAGEFVLKQRS